MAEWKKCKDELPPVGELVLCFSQRGGQFVGKRGEEVKTAHDKVFFDIPGYKSGGKLATHWKYLGPDPEDCDDERG